MKILMVCLGNICRSPLAEGIMKHKIAEQNLDWLVESRGTGGYHIGELPDSRSIDEARRRGLDITDQRSQKMHQNDLTHFDVIYAMDASNYRHLINMCNTEEQKEKVLLILNESQPGYNGQVPDPYWDDNGFSKVYDMLDEACDAAILRLNIDNSSD